MTRFIDANVIVKAFIKNKDEEKCRQALQEDFVTDTLCLVEAYHSIERILKDKKLAGRCIKSLFKKGEIIGLDKDLLFDSFRRAGAYNLNIFDLIHYVSALTRECTEFVSYDDDFDNLEMKRVEP